ncbi:DoxX family membrane protein [Pedobacter namyangjuensis]|uniref:DoxX family membrane protein n=1 Tax=Pedobacter namyangjuensis TaxID=600626 RepID=UPI000DE46B79|nr:DoxX family membrane protein [Pedobacter namyangjuensis]
MENEKTAFLLTRFGLAASMFTHGLVRLPKLETFSNWMVGNFEKSLLPKILVLPFSYVLPVLEFALGLFLIFGLLTKQTLIAGAAIMIVLIFGSGMIEEWNSIPSQLIHLGFFVVLLLFLKYNSFCLDKN